MVITRKKKFFTWNLMVPFQQIAQAWQHVPLCDRYPVWKDIFPFHEADTYLFNSQDSNFEFSLNRLIVNIKEYLIKEPIAKTNYIDFDKESKYYKKQITKFEVSGINIYELLMFYIRECYAPEINKMHCLPFEILCDHKIFIKQIYNFAIEQLGITDNLSSGFNELEKIAQAIKVLMYKFLFTETANKKILDKVLIQFESLYKTEEALLNEFVDCLIT